LKKYDVFTLKSVGISFKI